jgi:2-phosphoglycerate kinase
MRCEACNKNLTDREASRKYLNWRDIPNPEARYIMLCDGCIKDTGLSGIENPLASNEEIQDDGETDERNEDE